MSEILLDLAARIDTELCEIEPVVARAQQSWQRFQQSGDDLYVDGAALNLHGFYNGIERLFELIAAINRSFSPTRTELASNLVKTNDD